MRLVDRRQVGRCVYSAFLMIVEREGNGRQCVSEEGLYEHTHTRDA